ncbi:hypothetical protein SAMN05518801_106157 [Novosphingobium sp. CF614]|uniref:CPBP family intramembrane glutamic endopeptidase n=1 Tax=Novosphingobium sp. CF614 TaxID=1884364 RepID=UPI0008E4112C|nr:CPBP family intramembrane glutamic endopeptidase [Novosphingobium sp. CF614]SFG05404.1 hypothetical protein SAMN05518801_106157 [Novosphingobium sp. CF614]
MQDTQLAAARSGSHSSPSPPARAPATPPATPLWGLASLVLASVAAIAVLLGVPYVFGLLLRIPAIAAMPAAAIESLFTLATFGLLALAAYAAVRMGRIAVPLGTRRGLMAGSGVGLGVLALAVSAALCAIAGTAQEGMPAKEGMGLLLLETVLLLIQSGAEEYYFRGWLQADLQRRWGAWPALGAAALLFAALHFIAAASDPLSFVTLLLGGLLFGLAYRKSGSFLLPWGLHFGWNWAEELLFGLYPNPGSGTFGTLLNIDLAGSGWWGGTSEGLNASLSSVIALVAVLTAVGAWPNSTATAAGPWVKGKPARG